MDGMLLREFFGEPDLLIVKWYCIAILSASNISSFIFYHSICFNFTWLTVSTIVVLLLIISCVDKNLSKLKIKMLYICFPLWETYVRWYKWWKRNIDGIVLVETIVVINYFCVIYKYEVLCCSWCNLKIYCNKDNYKFINVSKKKYYLPLGFMILW